MPRFNNQGPSLIKVITHTSSNGMQFSTWPDFLESLIMMKHYEVREKGPRTKPFTSRVNRVTGKFEVVSTTKEKREPIFTKEEKSKTTPAQSTTYVHPERLRITPFQHNNATAVGLAFPSENAYVTRILRQDVNTTRRPFDADSEDEARKLLDKYHPFESLDALEGDYVQNEQTTNNYNEVLTRLYWDENNPAFRVMIFNDNSYSRLIAQARALDMYYAVCQRAKDNNQDTSNIKPPSIYVYESLAAYNEVSQKIDLKNSLREHSYPEYPLAKAIDALKNNKTLSLGDISLMTEELSKLSVYFSQAVLKTYLEELPDKDFSQIEENDIDGWLYVIRTQILLGGINIFNVNTSAKNFAFKDFNNFYHLLLHLPESKRWEFINDLVVKGELNGIVKNKSDVENILLALPQEHHNDFIENSNELTDPIKPYKFDITKLNEYNIDDVNKFDYIIRAMINDENEILPSYVIKNTLFSNKIYFSAVLNWLPSDRRLDFINHPYVSINLKHFVNNINDLLKLFEDVKPKAPDDIFGKTDIANNIKIIMKSDCKELVKDEKDLLKILQVCGSKFLCELIANNKDVNELYLSLAKEGKHMEILKNLHLNPKLDPAEKLVLKYTLFIYLHNERAVNNGNTSNKLSEKEKKLIDKFNNNDLEFSELLQSYKQEQSSSSSGLFKSWGTPVKTEGNVLQTIVESSVNRPKHGS